MIPCLIITEEVLVLVVPTVFFSWILFSHVPYPRTSMHQVRICITPQHHPCLLVNKYTSNMEGMDMKTPMCLFEAVGQNQPKNQGCPPQSLFLYIHTIYTYYIYICIYIYVLYMLFSYHFLGAKWRVVHGETIHWWPLRIGILGDPCSLRKSKVSRKPILSCRRHAK